MVPVITLGAESWEPSTVSTGISASLSRLKLVMAFSRVMLDGRACWKKSPAMIMKSGFSSMVLSTTSWNAVLKSSRRVSELYWV